MTEAALFVACAAAGYWFYWGDGGEGSVEDEKAESSVLDIDSDQLSSFDETDREGLEKIVGWFAR